MAVKQLSGSNNGKVIFIFPSDRPLISYSTFDRCCMTPMRSSGTVTEREKDNYVIWKVTLPQAVTQAHTNLIKGLYFHNGISIPQPPLVVSFTQSGKGWRGYHYAYLSGTDCFAFGWPYPRHLGLSSSIWCAGVVGGSPCEC